MNNLGTKVKLRTLQSEVVTVVALYFYQHFIVFRNGFLHLFELKLIRRPVFCMHHRFILISFHAGDFLISLIP